MKNQSNILISFLLGLTVLFSCNNNSQELTQLKKENEVLRSKIEILEKGIQNDTSLNYLAIAIPENRKIKLGEEYVARVFLCIEDKNNPLKVVLCNIVNDQPVPTKDTLNRSLKYGCPEYRVKPTKVGVYVWSGEVSRKGPDGFIHRYYFESKFEITH